MAHATLTGIPLYPEFRDCPAPSAERILEIFAPLSRHHLYHHDTLLETFEPELTTQKQQVLDLLSVLSCAPSPCTRTTPSW